MKYENKKFQVREYDDFPVKKYSDKVVREFNDLETAQFESMWLNKREGDFGRHYVIDTPHEEVKMTAKTESMLKDKYGLK